MNIHECQAKFILAQAGLRVPLGEAVSTLEEALAVADKLGGDAWVVKAQVHAGGRGKGTVKQMDGTETQGGVRIVKNKDEFKKAVKELLGGRLVTYQTDAQGQPINQLLIEEPSDIDRELYLGAVIDRAAQRLAIMVSTEGGVEIEKVAAESPEKIIKIMVDPLVGVMPYQARNVGFKLGFTPEQVKEFTRMLVALGDMFVSNDLSLLEINPLVVTKKGELVCLDGKINIDDNALYRHSDLRGMRDATQEDARENRARDWELNYIALEGDIGCMVNGAGLAMATMDVVKLHGGTPANFLDVGGGATKERVTEAFKIILSDTNVKGVLVNIFGGIVRCDLIADGIIGAIEEVGVSVPVVVRLEGNNAELGLSKLNECKLNIIAAEGLTDAAKKIVAAVGE